MLPDMSGFKLIEKFARASAIARIIYTGKFVRERKKSS